MIKPDAMAAALEREGWQAFPFAIEGYCGKWPHFRKRIAGAAMAGAFAPDGARIVTLRLHPMGKLERIGPWGEIEASANLYAMQSEREALELVSPAPIPV